MSSKVFKKIALVGTLLGSILVSGCGSSDPNGVNPESQNNYPGYNTGGYYTPGGCVPITSAIGFSGTNVNVSTTRLAASQGQLSIGTGPAPGATGYGSGSYYRSGVDGTIQVNLAATQNTNPYGYPQYATAGTVTGSVQLSAQALQLIQTIASGSGYGYGYPGYNYGYPGVPTPVGPTSICANAIAMDLTLFPGSGMTGGVPTVTGAVDLYMTGTPGINGYRLIF